MSSFSGLKAETLTGDLGKREEAKSVIMAIDGGGSGFRKAFVVGNNVKEFSVSGPVENVKGFIDFVCDRLPTLFPKTRGIAICMAGINRDNKIIVKSPNIPMLNGVNIAEMISDRCSLPVFVFGDMDGATMGVAQLMPWLKYYMNITWSSGVGARIFKNGRIVNIGAEMGHTPLDPSPFAPLCGCGLRGCLESVAGGRSVTRRVISECNALGIIIPRSTNPCQFLDCSYLAGQKWAINIYQLVATAMGIFLAQIQSHFALQDIVWKGTFAEKAMAEMEKLIRQVMISRLIDPELAKVRFHFSPDPMNDVLIGAATLFRQRVEGE